MLILVASCKEPILDVDFEITQQEEQIDAESSLLLDRCVMNLVQQFTGTPKLDIGKADRAFSFRVPHIHITKHIQGIAMFSDYDKEGRIAIVDNGSAGFTLAFNKITGATEGIYSSNLAFENPVSFRIRNNVEYGNHDHPGGMQAQGDIVAIAMEGGSARHAGVYFLEVKGKNISFLHALKLDEFSGIPKNINNKSAQAVGFVQQESGKYLVAIRGSYGILFFESQGTTINKLTRWDFVKHYAPPCTGYGKPNDQCLDGSNSINLVRDCSGEIYLLAMNGTNGARIDSQNLQVFSVALQTHGKIILKKVAQQRVNVGRLAPRHSSFRWSGGVYITKAGKIVLLNTKRREIGGKAYFGK